MNANAEIAKSETDQDFNEFKSASTKKITWSNADWCLRLYPNAFTNGYMMLTIVRLSSRVPCHTLEYSILSEVCLSIVHFEVAHFDEDHTEIHELELCVDTLRPARRDSMKVTCIVTCYESRAVDAFSQTEFLVQDDAKDVKVLCQNLKDLLLNGRDHDIVLKVKDREFRAHQNILRARSPVLDSMLSHDMAEKKSGVVDIPDCDPIAFEQFLIYLYSGGVDTLDAGNMLSLYYIADKYDAGDLKEECREFIKESLTTGNIMDVVQVALDHSDADILRRSTEYFVKQVDLILPTVEWMSFLKRNAVQANELFIKATKNMIGLMKTPLR